MSKVYIIVCVTGFSLVLSSFFLLRQKLVNVLVCLGAIYVF